MPFPSFFCSIALVCFILFFLIFTDFVITSFCFLTSSFLFLPLILLYYHHIPHIHILFFFQKYIPFIPLLFLQSPLLIFVSAFLFFTFMSLFRSFFFIDIPLLHFILFKFIFLSNSSSSYFHSSSLSLLQSPFFFLFCSSVSCQDIPSSISPYPASPNSFLLSFIFWLLFICFIPFSILPFPRHSYSLLCFSYSSFSYSVLIIFTLFPMAPRCSYWQLSNT